MKKDEIDGRPVTAIGDSAFRSKIHLSLITLPDTVVSTGEPAFSGCTALKEVIYAGTEEDWEKIRIGRWNEPLHSARKA